MTSIDEIPDLRDRRNQKVFGLLVIDQSFLFKYSCTFCDGEFLTPESLRNHLMAQHIHFQQPEPTAPTDIGKNYVRQFNAESSVLRSDYNKSAQEFNAMEIFRDTEPTTNATNQKHGPDSMFLDSAPKFENVGKKRQKPSFQCDFCPKTYLSLHSKRLHMRTRHSTQLRHICPICPKAFKYNEELEAHTKTHTNNTEYTCFFCGAVLRSKYEKESHNKQFHPQSVYKCKICHQEFKQDQLLWDHHKKEHLLTNV